MHLCIGGTPSTKKVYKYQLSEDIVLTYIATKTREILNIYNTEVKGYLGSIFVTKKRLDEVFGYTVQVYGSYELYEKYIGLSNGTYVKEFDEANFSMFEEVTERLGSYKANKLPVKYTILEQAMELNLDKHNSIEEYLYENVPFEDLIKEKNLDLTWTEGKDYRILTSREDIEAFIEGLANSKDIVGFDTETSGLLVGRVKLDKLVGMSMSYEDDTGYYFPIDHKRIRNIEMPLEEFLAKLKPYIDYNSPLAKPLVAHNGAFDWKVLRQHGIDLNIVHDTYIRVSLMDSRNSKTLFSLKDIVSHELGITVLELSDMYKDKSRQEIKAIKKAVFEQGLPIDETTKYKLERVDFFKGRNGTLPYDFRYASYEFSELYGSADADFPRILFKLQEKEWDTSLNMVYKIEMEAMRPIAIQEYYGIKTDRDALLVIYDEQVKKLEELTQEIYAIAGEEFNINSSNQLANIMFDKLGYEYLPRFNTKRGGRGTGMKVLKYLAGQKTPTGNVKYPLADLLIKYSKLNKLITSFYGNLPNLIHNGVLFPNYKQLGTDTGRISANNPNIQQMEPGVRYHMHVDNPDTHYMMICDYSQVEYRVMGGLSGEPKVVDFFRSNPEADYHIQAYANMHDIPYEDVTSAQRSEGKILNFGTTYGLEDANLANNLFGNSSELHQHLAREARKKYFEGIPVLRDYFEEVRDKAEIDGYVTTLFGRKRYIPEFQGKNVNYISEYDRASGRRKAGNTPVQGTAADIQKLAMYRIRQAFFNEGISEEDVHLILNVHDEVAIHVNKKYHPFYVLGIMRKAMEMDLSKFGLPPLYIGAIIGTNWGAGQNDDMEMPVILMEEIKKRVEENNIKYTPEDVSVEDLLAQWQEEINQFAVRQIHYEVMEQKHTTMEECRDNGRITTYSKYFDNPDLMIKLVLDNKDNEEFIQELQLKYREYHEQYPDYEYVKEEVVEEVEVVKGKELEQDNSLKYDLQKVMYINKLYKNDTLHTVHIHTSSHSVDLLEVIQAMLVEDDAFKSGIFKDNQHLLRVRIYLDTETPYVIKHKGILSGFIPLLSKFIITDRYGVGSFENAEKVIDKLGTTLIKPEYL